MTCSCNARDCVPGSGHESYCGRVETDSETSVASVIAADKALIERSPDSIHDPGNHAIAFYHVARERWPVYIAAIEAVTDMEERFAEIGHNGHEQWEGEPECPGCVAADLRRALAVLSTEETT